MNTLQTYGTESDETNDGFKSAYLCVCKCTRLFVCPFFFLMFVTMKARYIKKIFDWASGLKESTTLPLSKLTNEPADFVDALALLSDTGHNCGIVEGENYVYKSDVKPARVKISAAQALLLVEAGVLQQCPPKRGAFLLFPSGTAMELKAVAKGWVSATKTFDGQVTWAQYTSKELPLEKLFIIDYPLYFN